MLRGIETAASGMIALQRKQDALTNNLANAETPGYKQDASPFRAFPDLLLEQIHNQKLEPGKKIGTLTTGVYNQETLALFTQGSLFSTNRSLDVAINDSLLAPIVSNNKSIKPAILFAVQTADGGFHLTRNGNFSVNASGQLITASGDLVLGQNGAPISDPELASGNVAISENGEIILHPNGASPAKSIGSLGLVVVNDPAKLVKEGNGLFTIEGGNPSMIAQTVPSGVQLQHKMLEQSNVDLGQTITEMMANIRLYEANQKVLQAYDKTLEQLNTVGRV
ncbi:flagellar hook-basal body protein [Neobacillus sp. 19]|uniref:flagellar hook-basal body protein n=1 Tax=Neobacillus sp. 19 TaxID=3394458 RepID=UPI003BF628AA